MADQTIIMIILAGIIAALLFSIIRLGRGNFNQLAAKMADRDRKNLQVLKPCPLCQTLLQPGERVKSIYYRETRPGNHRLPVEEIHTRIYGCPHCWPHRDDKPRVCPVCHQTLAADAFVIARTFRKPGRKDHVHVIGCSHCKKFG